MKIFLTIKGVMVIIGMITYLFSKPCECEDGVVVNKIYHPAYETEVDSYSVIMDAPMKEKRKHREKFILVLDVNEKTKNCEVEDDVYQAYYVGDQFLMEKIN